MKKRPGVGRFFTAMHLADTALLVPAMRFGTTNPELLLFDRFGRWGFAVFHGTLEILDAFAETLAQL